MESFFFVAANLYVQYILVLAHLLSLCLSLFLGTHIGPAGYDPPTLWLNSGNLHTLYISRSLSLSS